MCMINNSYSCHQSNNILGTWYFPNGSEVGNDMSVENNGFYQSRNEMLVRLIRKGSPEERGSFRCEIPDACNKTHKIFVNIGRY